MVDINEVVKAKIVEHVSTLYGLIGDREEEIDRMNNQPKGSRSKVTYEASNPDSKDAVEIAEAINAGKWSKAAIDFQVGKGVVRKIEKIASEKTPSGLSGIDKKIKEITDAIKQVATSQKPEGGRKSTGSGDGSHAITKAWFDSHYKDCPQGMKVEWDAATNRITYEYPPGSKKSGRGGTVSHGALANMVKAWESVPVVEPKVAEPKKVPAKKKK